MHIHSNTNSRVSSSSKKFCQEGLCLLMLHRAAARDNIKTEQNVVVRLITHARLGSVLEACMLLTRLSGHSWGNCNAWRCAWGT